MGLKYYAFSLIELMVVIVIAIVSVLAAVAVPYYKKYIFISSITPLYQIAMNNVQKSIIEQSTKGEFSISPDSIGVPPVTTLSPFAGDSYNNGWAGFASAMYGTSTCKGRMGVMNFKVNGPVFGNAPQDLTSNITFWLSHKNGAVKAYCTITIYTTDPDLRTLTIQDCENTGGSVWNKTNTPVVNAAMSESTCP